MKYVVKFIRDDEHTVKPLRAWYIHNIGESVDLRGYPYHKWRFTNRQSARRAIRRLHRFKLNFKAKMYPIGYNWVILLTFKTDEDEAEFMLKALSDQLTLTHFY